MAVTKWTGGALAGKVDGLIFQNYRGLRVVREYTKPRNPRTPEQQAHRNVFGLSSRISATLYNQLYKGRIKKDLGVNPFNTINKTVYEGGASVPYDMGDVDLPYDWVVNGAGDTQYYTLNGDDGYYKQFVCGIESEENLFDENCMIYIAIWNDSKNAYVTSFEYCSQESAEDETKEGAFMGYINLDFSFQKQGFTPFFYTYFQEEKGISNFFSDFLWLY